MEYLSAHEFSNLEILLIALQPASRQQLSSRMQRFWPMYLVDLVMRWLESTLQIFQYRIASLSAAGSFFFHRIRQ
jgi:hypothetical protein